MEERTDTRISVLETNIEHILQRLDDIARKLDKLTDNLQAYYEKQIELEKRVDNAERQIAAHERFDMAKDQSIVKDIDYLKQSVGEIEEQVEALKQFRWMTLGIQLISETLLIPLILWLLGK